MLGIAQALPVGFVAAMNPGMGMLLQLQKESLRDKILSGVLIFP